MRFERTADMLAKSGLLDITMKTAELLRSNQQARQDLVSLKQEIDQFMESVLANPENQVKIVELFYNINFVQMFLSAAFKPAFCTEKFFLKSS